LEDLKFSVKEKRIINFQRLLDYLIDTNGRSIKQVQPLINYVAHQVKSLDKILVIAENAKRDKISREEFEMLLKKLGASAIASLPLLMTGNPIAVIYIIAGFAGSDYTLGSKNSEEIQKIRQNFDRFSLNIKSVQNFLNDEQQSLSLTKEKLISLKQSAKSVKRDVSAIINDENEETVLGEYALGDELELQVVLAGLEHIQNKSQEIRKLMSEILNDNFRLK
jgi:hypothetical protein